jgi:CRISPR-associated endonuclease Cas2
MTFVAVYDICNPKRLSKVAKLLESVGLRVQNSTFEIDKDVVNVNIEELFDELVSLCENEDKIFIYKTKEKQDIQAKTDNWEMVF